MCLILRAGQSSLGQVAEGGGGSSSSSIQTGFAVVTPVEGNDPLSLRVSEVFSQTVGDDVFRSSVLPCPLVTLTSMLIQVNPETVLNTGIAIVNPNPAPAVILMTLNNTQGLTVAAGTLTIGGFQQTSKFVTELLPSFSALAGPFSGVLFIRADVPVGVQGLVFLGPSFTALPVAEQLFQNSVPINTAGGLTNTFTPFSAPTGQTASITSVTPPTQGQPTAVVTTANNTPIAALGAPALFLPSTPAPLAPTIPLIPTPFPLPSPVLPMPTPFPLGAVPSLSTTVPPIQVTPLPGTVTSLSSGNLGVPRVQPPASISAPPSQPITGLSEPFVTAVGIQPTTPPVVDPATITNPIVVTPFPEIALGVGGRLAQLLPQVATGGGWASTIAIVNNSTTTQVVRVDFFNQFGGPMNLSFGSTVPRLVIPPGGVVTVSTE
jgi:hypothetical protein